MNSRRFLISLKVVAFLFFSSSNQIALKAGNILVFNSEKIKELYYSLPKNYQANIKELQNTESQIFIIQTDDLCSTGVYESVLTVIMN
jgi:hypothetical protein